jgi:hypothetical protein
MNDLFSAMPRLSVTAKWTQHQPNAKIIKAKARHSRNVKKRGGVSEDLSI